MPEALNPQAFAPRLAEDVVAGSLGAEAKAALDERLGRARIIWQPNDADMSDRRHLAVMRYWEELPKVDGVADVVNVDAAKLVPALGYLLLVDADDSGTQFRYHLYGSAIAQVTDFDMTGRRIEDTLTTPSTLCFLLACYRAICTRRLPLYTEHEAPPNITTNHWHRLLLPLGTGGAVQRIMVCMIPVRVDIADNAAPIITVAQS